MRAAPFRFRSKCANTVCQHSCELFERCPPNKQMREMKSARRDRSESLYYVTRPEIRYMSNVAAEDGSSDESGSQSPSPSATSSTRGRWMSLRSLTTCSYVSDATSFAMRHCTIVVTPLPMSPEPDSFRSRDLIIDLHAQASGTRRNRLAGGG